MPPPGKGNAPSKRGRNLTLYVVGAVSLVALAVTQLGGANATPEAPLQPPPPPLQNPLAAALKPQPVDQQPAAPQVMAPAGGDNPPPPALPPPVAERTIFQAESFDFASVYSPAEPEEIAKAYHDLKDITAGAWAAVDLAAYNELAAAMASAVGGAASNVPLSRKIYVKLAQLPIVKRICEIGFDDGASAAVWLKANPEAEVLVFDVWQTPGGVATAEQKLRSPETAKAHGLNNTIQRLKIIKGRPAETVLEFHAAYPDVRCDILSIKASASVDAAGMDIKNFQNLANPNFNVLVVGATNCGQPYCLDAAVVDYQKRGVIRRIFGVAEVTRNHGVSVFQYDVVGGAVPTAETRYLPKGPKTPAAEAPRGDPHKFENLPLMTRTDIINSNMDFGFRYDVNKPMSRGTKAKAAKELLTIALGAWKKVDLTEFTNLVNGLRDPNVPVGEGGSIDLVFERQIYVKLAQMANVKRICEIGFNAGGSAAIWLKANPDAEVLMFDLWQHQWAPIAESQLRSAEKMAAYDVKDANRRLTIVRGSSLETVLEFHAKYPDIKCDLLSVDGGHTYDIAVEDIRNMMNLANPDFNVLVVDDTNCASDYCVDKPVQEHQARGAVRRVFGTSEHSATRGVTVLQYRLPDW